jgi:hypothetical protein
MYVDFLLVMVLVGMIAFGFQRGGDISTPYVQSLRLIVKNSVLWVMFLASMSASVFFSFDSHFNAIFPAEQRKRAAEIRTTSQIGNVVSDIGAITQKRQIEEAEALFSTDGWKAYDAQLNLAGLAGCAGRDREVLRAADGGPAPRHQPTAGAHRHLAERPGRPCQQEDLADRRAVRLKAERPGLVAEYAPAQERA